MVKTTQLGKATQPFPESPGVFPVAQEQDGHRGMGEGGGGAQWHGSLSQGWSVSPSVCCSCQAVTRMSVRYGVIPWVVTWTRRGGFTSDPFIVTKAVFSPLRSRRLGCEMPLSSLPSKECVVYCHGVPYTLASDHFIEREAGQGHLPIGLFTPTSRPTWLFKAVG